VITGPQVLDVAPGLDHGADRLVAENAAGGGLGNVALEDVQVGTADRDRVDADDGVPVVGDIRVGYLLPLLAAGAAVNQRLHGVLPLG
jgi:hypothetical protein